MLIQQVLLALLVRLQIVLNVKIILFVKLVILIITWIYSQKVLKYVVLLKIVKNAILMVLFFYLFFNVK